MTVKFSERLTNFQGTSGFFYICLTPFSRNQFMNRLIIILLLLYFSNQGGVYAQETDTGLVDLFSLYENASDQEGMFYLPPVRKGGLFSGSKKLSERRLQMAQREGNHRTIANVASNLAWLELEEGNNEQSLAYFEIAIDALNRNPETKGIGFLHLQKGFVYYRSLEFESALENFRLALQQMEQNKNTTAIPVAQAMIAQTHLVMKDFAMANTWYAKAWDGFSANGNQKAMARIGVQLAEIAIRKGDHTSARKHLDKSLDYFRKVNDKSGQALVHRDLGIIRYKEGEYDEAIGLYKISLEFSGQLSVAKLLKDTYLKLFTLKSVAGEYDASNEINILYVQLRDSIDQVERSRVLNSQLTRRELTERESIQEMLRKDGQVSYQQLSAQELERNRQLTDAEIERLEKEKIIEDLNVAKRISDLANMEREERIQQLTRERSMQDLALSRKELEVSQAQTLRNTLIIAIASVIIISGLLYNRYRNQRKSHRELDKAYKELSETHHKLLAAQEQLVHAQKMASLGQLTAGIAHEIQNPLNFVNNFSELSIELIEELKQPGALKDEILADLSANLEKIHSHGKRADKIVKGMLLHSRTGQAEKQASDLNKMIDELLELSYHGNRSRDNSFRAEIIRNLDPSLPAVPVVAQEISRVLINLFNNAFYAVGQRARQEGAGYKATVGVSTRVDGNQVVIRIRDNGTGISEELKKKIFDPFFTTKPAGEGTGLGLSLSYDIIVKGHNGSLRVDSQPGSFTEFIISLPLT
jgi:signal transduction histidine kinase